MDHSPQSNEDDDAFRSFYSRAVRRPAALVSPLAKSFRISTNQLILAAAAYLWLTQNLSFWKFVAGTLSQHWTLPDYSLIGALMVALYIVLVLLLGLFGNRLLLKPALMVLLLAASVCSYFMDSFGTVIDHAMIANALHTDAREAGELIGWRLMAHVTLWGALPAMLVMKVKVHRAGMGRELLRRLMLVVLALVVFVGVALANYKTVSLWARHHRDVRMFVNPVFPVYSLWRAFKGAHQTAEGPVQRIALDAVRTPAAAGKPRVVIVVVGETARRRNFQLFGYARETNPELARVPDLVGFSEVESCGTVTLVSVPCMFSRLGRSAFSRSKASREENLLDVAQRTGVEVLWRDNNSDCKGACLRVPTENLLHAKVAGACTEEGCRDEVLLDGLDQRIARAKGDLLVVLHMLGSHGPSYYKRYPASHRRFTPDCAQDDVQKCSREAIVNAYDNTILYTDHVLAGIIAVLNRHRDTTEPTMLYASDHGESLGENGIYLHGIPRAFAPREQIEVPLLLWSPGHRAECLRSRSGRPYSHDNLFHTLLGLLQIETTEYRKEMDITAGCLR